MAVLKRHDWQIEAREYARQEERGGRRFAFTHLVPARTALVVIDMIPFFVTPGSYAEGIVPNIQALVAAIRECGGLVAWVVPARGRAIRRWRVNSSVRRLPSFTAHLAAKDRSRAALHRTSSRNSRIS